MTLSAACASRPQTVDVQVLAFNDFHGTLEPAAGSNGRVQAADAGGVEFFASRMAQLRAANANTIVVSAGDSIGASTLMSGMFHDEPTIEALNAVGLQISTVGNHEFDEGWAELYRMQHGGCHPADGCQDQTPFAGATFEFLSANVDFDPAQADPQDVARSGWQRRGRAPQTLFPASTIREIGGVKIGFIGLVLQGTAEIVSPAGTRGLTFRPVIEAGNDAAAALTAQGVNAIVLLIHEGGTPGSDDPNGCDLRGPIVDIANGLSSDVDVIVSGHTHRAYVCTLGTKLVTSALSLGRVITDIELTIDRRSGDVVRKSARNEVVTRDLPKSATVTALLDHYRPLAAALGSRPVGMVTTELLRRSNPAGESALGDVVADAYLERGLAVDPAAVAALTNAGGIRADLIGRPPAQPGGPRQVVYEHAFDMLPFGNVVVVKSMTGEGILQWLEQQFDNPEPASDTILQSSGLTYRYTRTRPPGQRVDRQSLMIGGRPLVPAQRYRIVSVDFVWNGGDGFTTAAAGTDPVAVGVDVDVFVDYLGRQSPLAPGRQDRIRKQP